MCTSEQRERCFEAIFIKHFATLKAVWPMRHFPYLIIIVTESLLVPSTSVCVCVTLAWLNRPLLPDFTCCYSRDAKHSCFALSTMLTAMRIFESATFLSAGFELHGTKLSSARQILQMCSSMNSALIIRPVANFSAPLKHRSLCMSPICRCSMVTFFEKTRCSSALLIFTLFPDVMQNVYVDWGKDTVAKLGPVFKCFRHLGQRANFWQVLLGKNAEYFWSKTSIYVY